LTYAALVAIARGDVRYFLGPLGPPAVRVRITQWYQLLQPFMVMWLLSKRTPSRVKPMIGIGVMILFMGMLLSATRAAFVSVAIQLPLYVIWYPLKLGTSRAKLVAILVVLGLLVSIAWLSVPSRLVETSLAHAARLPLVGSNLETLASDSRVVQYLSMVRMYLRDLNWFTGIGFGHFEAVFHYHYFEHPEMLGMIWTDAHSLLITLPLEMGVLGIVVLWLFVSGTWTNLRRTLSHSRLRGDREVHELAVACTASVFALLPSLIFQGPPLLDRNFYFLTSIVSILWLIECQKGNKHDRSCAS
jgi:hypothetical protein